MKALILLALMMSYSFAQVDQDIESQEEVEVQVSRIDRGLNPDFLKVDIDGDYLVVRDIREGGALMSSQLGLNQELTDKERNKIAQRVQELIFSKSAKNKNIKLNTDNLSKIAAILEINNEQIKVNVDTDYFQSLIEEVDRNEIESAYVASLKAEIKQAKGNIQLLADAYRNEKNQVKILERNVDNLNWKIKALQEGIDTLVEQYRVASDSLSQTKVEMNACLVENADKAGRIAHLEANWYNNEEFNSKQVNRIEKMLLRNDKRERRAASK